MNNYIKYNFIYDNQDDGPAIRWNPYNKVVQDHKNGAIYLYMTDIARKKRGLPTPWNPDMAIKDVKDPPVY